MARIQVDIKEIRDGGKLRRIFASINDLDKITVMRRQFDEALSLFQVGNFHHNNSLNLRHINPLISWDLC